MELVKILLGQIGIMFIFMMIGFLLFRTGKISREGSKEIGNILIYVIIPAVVMNAYMTDFSVERFKKLFVSFFLSFLALALSMFLAHIIFKKHSIEDFGTAFSNAGFMGIPIIQAMLGNEAVFYASAFVALLNIFQWTYGVFIITKDRSKISLKKILTNPVLLSMIAGILLFCLPLEVPEIGKKAVSLLAGMNAPVAMISIGVYLAQITAKELFSDATAYKGSFVRMILIPMATLGFLSLFPAFDKGLKLAVLIAAASPVGSNVAIFAQIHNKDYIQAVKSICLSTVLSIVTMPLIVFLADLLWKI